VRRHQFSSQGQRSKVKVKVKCHRNGITVSIDSYSVFFAQTNRHIDRRRYRQYMLHMVGALANKLAFICGDIFVVCLVGENESLNCAELNACMKRARTELFSLYDTQTSRHSSTRHRCQ